MIDRLAARPRRIGPLVAALGLLALTASPALAGPPSGLMPAEGATSYYEYDGLDAHARAWEGSAAREILDGTTAGATLAEAERRVVDRSFQLAKLPPEAASDLVALREHLVRRGFAVGSYSTPDDTSRVFVINKFDAAKLGSFERLLGSILQWEKGAAIPATRVRGRELRGFGGWDGRAVADDSPKGLTWWLDGDSLVLVKGPSPNLFDPLKLLREGKDLQALHRARVGFVLDAIEGKRPAVATHPAYAASKAEGGDMAGFEPSGLFFAEAVGESGVFEALGAGSTGKFNEFSLFEVADLNRARRVVGRWGFRGKSLATDVRFVLPSPSEGVLDRLGFSKGQIPPIPPGMGTFAVARLDHARAEGRLAILKGAMKGASLGHAEAIEGTANDPANRPLVDALLGHLGTACVYAAPGGAKGAESVPSLVVEFDDAGAVEKALTALADRINSKTRERSGGGIPALAVERLPAPDRGFRLASPSGAVAWLNPDLLARDGLPRDYRPTVLIGRSHLVAARSLTLARAGVDAESKPASRMVPSGELARSIEALPDKISFLSVGNPRDSIWPEVVPHLPETIARGLEMFAGIAANDEGRKPDLLAVLGFPKGKAGAVRPPSAEELASRIHPSVFAASVDDRSVRIVALEALPLACLGMDVKFSDDGKMEIKARIRP